MLEKTLKRYGEEIMKEVSKRYNIELKELMKMINVEVKEKVERKNLSKIPMPFLGNKCEKSCSGIRLNHGLYTQCVNEKKEKDLCETCLKQMEKNSNVKPRYGYIDERIELGENYIWFFFIIYIINEFFNHYTYYIYNFFCILM